MPYTTLAELTDRYGTPVLVDLTDRGEVATGVVDTGVVDRALADTDAVIDGYLAVRYVLPLSEVPPLVREIALALAIYKLHVFEPNEKIARDHRDAIGQLKDIARGMIRIEADGVEPDTTGGGGARVTDRERPMTEQSLKGFI